MKSLFKLFWKSALVLALIPGALWSCEEIDNPEDLLDQVSFKLDPPEVTIPAEGGTATVSLNAPVAWKAEAKDNWVSADPAKGDAGKVTVTLQRFKRAINILAKIGIIGVLPIEGEQVNFEYCDLFLCDPGLEYIWGSKTNREHAIESIVYSNGVRNGYKPYRLVLDANRIIDIVFDDQIPSAIDIKLRDTNSSSLSAAKFDYFREKGITYKPFILVDKGYTSSRHVDKAWILPIWAFLLME